MSQNLPVNGFKWIENNEINEEFIKNYNENKDKGYILEVDVNYMIYIVIYHSYQKELKLINVKNSFVIYVINKIRCAYKIIKTSIKSWIKI